MRSVHLIVCFSVLLLVACEPTPTTMPVAVSPTMPATKTASVAPTPTTASLPTATLPPTLTPTQTATPTGTPTPTQTPTATPVPSFTLSGVVFFDYNGNGIHDDGELPIPGATVQVGSLIATAASDGTYSLENALIGTQAVRVSADGFHYISLSLETIQSSARPISLVANSDTRRDWGLTQGFLTLPFKCCPSFIRNSPFGMTGMFDVDRRVGHVRSYDPEHIRPDYESNGIPPWVYDNHDGIDYCFVENTPIVAPVAGTLTEFFEESDGLRGAVMRVQIGDQSYNLIFNHINEVTVPIGTRLGRGDQFALSGNTGRSGEPHLHFGIGTWTTPPNRFDPYRDLESSTSISYWTVDNNPQYPP